MVKNPKCKLLCFNCDKILNDSIHMPCHYTLCKIHLREASVSSNGIITCKSCGKDFEVKNIEPTVNRHAKINLDAEDYLSAEEKTLKSYKIQKHDCYF